MHTPQETAEEREYAVKILWAYIPTSLGELKNIYDTPRKHERTDKGREEVAT